MSIDWKFDLERIRYDPAQAGPLEREMLAQYGIGQPEDVVVLFADFHAVPAPGPVEKQRVCTCVHCDDRCLPVSFRPVLFRDL